MRYVIARVVILVVGVSMSAGCARLTHGQSNRFFVNRESGVLEVKAKDAPPPAEAPPEPTLEEAIGKVRRLMSEVRPVASPNKSATLESSDPELMAALAIAEVMPVSKNYNEVARLYHRRQLLDRAYDYYTRSLRLTPRQSRAYEGLARVWRDWGVPGFALGDAYRAVHYDPLSASARNTLGTVLQALGRRSEARRAYLLVLASDSQAAYAFNNLCYLSFLDGQTERAIAECGTAIRLDHQLTAAHNNLGLTYAATARLDLAREQFALAGGAAATAYNLGVVHMAEHRFAEAAKEFRAAQALYPGFTEAGRRASDADRRAARVNVVPANTKGDD